MKRKNVLQCGKKVDLGTIHVVLVSDWLGRDHAGTNCPTAIAHATCQVWCGKTTWVNGHALQGARHARREKEFIHRFLIGSHKLLPVFSDRFFFSRLLQNFSYFIYFF